MHQSEVKLDFELPDGSNLKLQHPSEWKMLEFVTDFNLTLGRNEFQEMVLMLRACTEDFTIRECIQTMTMIMENVDGLIDIKERLGILVGMTRSQPKADEPVEDPKKN